MSYQQTLLILNYNNWSMDFNRYLHVLVWQWALNFSLYICYDRYYCPPEWMYRSDINSVNPTGK